MVTYGPDQYIMHRPNSNYLWLHSRGAQWTCLEQNKSQSVASVCKVMVNKMGVYKKNTQTLEKLFLDYGMMDLYFSRRTLLSKKQSNIKSVLK